jgi:ParB-like chromosome segregation protein Spo0J
MRKALAKTWNSPAHVSREIEHLPISKLKAHDQNARTHSPKQLKQIARSIDRFGFVNPILVDGSGTIICGHGRVGGAKLLGIAQPQPESTHH